MAALSGKEEAVASLPGRECVWQVEEEFVDYGQTMFLCLFIPPLLPLVCRL